jgi:hypothetical protein
MSRKTQRICAVTLAMFYGAWAAPAAQAYAFNMLVPDVRQPVGVSGGSACPVRAHQLTTAGSLVVRWSTAVTSNPVTVFTQNQRASGRLGEIELVITQSLAAWTGVTAPLTPATLARWRERRRKMLAARRIKFICFDQADVAFTPGVGGVCCDRNRPGLEWVGSSAVATQLGQISTRTSTLIRASLPPLCHAQAGIDRTATI